ncbi:GUN4 domain-containing protein [Leptolyngbya sp. FACHB-16]|uniref:GUN4 domain-containing protein n=1 Tax=unclassified Leptolyngbya TaxID=2650499 RepID=UPI001682CEB3|nr:GUN4 domain-containing protein [Leptolyngbya sp. FACHB-16]MBD2155205.1 GUN4 domain-containing protein [Leptolyngbya sp. FACHB-16]
MQRYPLVHKPKQPVSQPQITVPVIGEGRFARMAEGGYGHVILQLEPNPENDGCYMVWSVTVEFTPHINPDYLLTTDYLSDVYQGLCEAMTDDEKSSSWISYIPFPYENTNIRIIGGSEHPIDSRSHYYRRAAYLALEDAISKLGSDRPEDMSLPGNPSPVSNEAIAEKSPEPPTEVIPVLHEMTVEHDPKQYPLIHKPKKPTVSQPQITIPVRGEGRHLNRGYGHVILQLEPNPDNDGCFMLWSANSESTDRLPLTTTFLDDVYWGLQTAITEGVDRQDWICYVPFPYENTNIRIIDGSERPIDSRSVYYQMAAYFALEDAVSKVLAVTLPEQPAIPANELPLLVEPVIENPRYYPLQNALRQQKWRDADELTKDLIFRLGGGEYSDRDEAYWLGNKWTQQIPTADLQLIDRLWRAHGEGRFGFSVQKHIFLECGGQTGDRTEQEAWKRFDAQVGWTLEDDDPRKEIIRLLRFNVPQNQVFHRQAPVGYFPCLQEWGYESVKQELIQLFLIRELP